MLSVAAKFPLKNLGFGAGLTVLWLASHSIAFAQLSPQSFETPEFYANWGLDPIRAQYAWSQGFTGDGVSIAIVDSPVQLTHPEFVGRQQTPIPRYTFPVPGFPIPPHGTHVMGLAGAGRNGFGIIGTAFDSQLISVSNRGLNNPGYVGVFDWGAAVVASGATVMNGSFVFQAQPQRVVNNTYNYNWDKLNYLAIFPSDIGAYRQNITTMADNDVVMVFSAGNDKAIRNTSAGGPEWVENQPIATRIPNFPGSLPLITPDNSALVAPLYRFLSQTSSLTGKPEDWDYVPLEAYEDEDFSYLAGTLIAVVATDQNDQIAPFSNRCGAAADWCIAAPGLDLLSTLPMDTYGTDFGTSMSAPLVAGGAALVRQAFPYMTARQVIEVVLTTATDLGDPLIFGHGLLNLERAVKGPIEFGHPSLIEGNDSIFGEEVEVDDGKGGSFKERIFAVDTQGYDSVWRNDITGVGGFSKAGAGMLTLTGDNAYKGGTTITGGILRVDGSIADSRLLTIGAQATLQGIGTVGTTEVAGVLSPGNSVGTLTVAGGFELLSGSTYLYEIDAAQNGDLVVVKGDATIGSGVIFQLSAEDGVFLNQPYQLLDVSGSLNGTFERLHTNYTFIDLDFVATDSDLGVAIERNDVSMASFAQTNNQRAVANAIDAQRSGDEPYNDALLNDDPSQLPGWYQDWSGEIYSANQAALLYNSRLVAQVVNWRLQDSWLDSDQSVRLQQVGQTQAHGSPGVISTDTTVWSQAYGNWDSFSATADALKASANSGGFILGVDHQVSPSLRLGGGLSVSNTSTSVAASQAFTQGYSMLLYGTYGTQAFRLNGGVVQSWQVADVSRTLPLDDQGNARGTVASRSTQLFAEMSAPIGLESNTTLWPFAQVSQTWLHTSNFGETDAEAALAGRATHAQVGFGTLGARLSHQWETEKTSWQASVSAGWQRAWGDLSPATTLAFATGPDFTVSAAAIARDAAVIELGIGASLGPSSRLNVVYATTPSGQSSSQMLQAQLQWWF